MAFLIQVQNCGFLPSNFFQPHTVIFLLMVLPQFFLHASCRSFWTKGRSRPWQEGLNQLQQLQLNFYGTKISDLAPLARGLELPSEPSAPWNAVNVDNQLVFNMCINSRYSYLHSRYNEVESIYIYIKPQTLIVNQWYLHWFKVDLLWVHGNHSKLRCVQVKQGNLHWIKRVLPCIIEKPVCWIDRNLGIRKRVSFDFLWSRT